jgi:two-component system sensor histidine kinase VicK
MLFVARANSATIEINPRRFDIISQINEILADQASAIMRKHNQTLSLDFQMRQLFITADMQYIRMCLENLISNATKYTPDGGQIEISARLEGNDIIIAIKDNGVGVSRKDLKMLFQKFTRIPNELTNKVSGSGIGLYLAKKIVEAHGGSISFKSKVRLGSTCTIILPVRKNGKSNNDEV